MLFFVYCRDRADVADKRMAHREEHWTFMDGYADVMIGRGPTQTPDGSGHTGSMHIVDLPDLEAAKVFAYDEPYAKAGVFEDIMIRRWTNALDRTMWDFEGDAEANQRFLFIGHGRVGPDVTERRNALLEAHRAFLAPPEKMRHQILRGPLWDETGETWTGSLFLLEAKDRSAAEAFFEGEPYTEGGLYEHTELHGWRFGGRH